MFLGGGGEPTFCGEWKCGEPSVGEEVESEVEVTVGSVVVVVVNVTEGCVDGIDVTEGDVVVVVGDDVVTVGDDVVLVGDVVTVGDGVVTVGDVAVMVGDVVVNVGDVVITVGDVTVGVRFGDVPMEIVEAGIEEGGGEEIDNSGATGSDAVGGGATDEPADLFEAINVSSFSANDSTLL